MERGIPTLLMIRPANFGFNPETAVSNHYQNASSAAAGSLQELALNEFDAFAALLERFEIPVLVYNDDASVIRPDAIFPNNWFSTHPGKSMVLYPMEAPNRRTERRNELISALQREYSYTTIHDLTAHENEGRYLEGTGSILFDHVYNLAWASFSSRTNADVLLEACEKLGMLPVVFSATDSNGLPVYHTNVIMALHPKLAIVCLDAITDSRDRIMVERVLQKSGRTIVEISQQQVSAFAGNALFVKNRAGIDHVIMSATGWNSLNDEQRQQISAAAIPVTPEISTIEQTGGGSARCMLAELY
ncbi:MAG: citrulline utilization hydrolase CtlX [Bacteroidia bacterium]